MTAAVPEHPWYILGADVPLYQKHLAYKARAEQLTLAEQQDAVNNAAILCKRNPAFLGHEYMWIRLKRGGRARFNDWTPGQRRVYRMERWMRNQSLPVRIIVLKARRQGVSTLSELLGLQCTAFNRDAHALVAAHKKTSADAIYRMFGLFLDSLPASLTPMIERDNADEIIFDNPDRKLRKKQPGLGSSIRNVTVALGGGRKDEQGKGRGETYQFIHGSECAFWAEPAEFWSGVSQTVDESPETTIILESTANGFGWFYEMWEEAARGWSLQYDPAIGRTRWVCLDRRASRSSLMPVFLSWLEEPTYRWPFRSESDRAHLAKHIDPEEQRLVAEFGATLEQLNWRRRILYGEKFNGDLQMFHQEYPTTPAEAFISSGRKVFDFGALAMAEDAVRNRPVPSARCTAILSEIGMPRMLEDPDGPITIFRHPEPNHTYSMGVDGSYGKVKGDKSCAQVLCNETWEQVAIIHGQLAHDELARLCVAVGRYYHEALAVVEVNGPGIAVQSEMETLGYGSFYWRTVPDSISPSGKSYGWWTTGKTRRLMVSRLQEAVRDMRTGTGLVLHDVGTIKELQQWVVKVGATGKAKEEPASSQGYDDRVTSLGIALVGGVHENGQGFPIASATVDNPDGKEQRRAHFDPAVSVILRKSGQATGSLSFHPVLGIV